MAIRPGLVSVTFRSLLVKKIIQLSVACGLEGIEWGGDIHVPHGDIRLAREVGVATVEAGLAVAAYGSYYWAGESESTGLSFSSVCDTAASLRAPTIRIWAGTKNAEDATPEYRDKVLADIQRVGKLAGDAGMSVSLELHRNTLANTVKSVIEFLSAVSGEHLQTYWQPPLELPLPAAIEGLREVLPWLSNVHVFHWWPDSNFRHALETGQNHWQQYFDVLKADKKNRWALLEFVQGDK